MNRRILLGAIGFAIGYFIEDQIASIKSDLARYDRLREMSDEPPFLREQLSRLWEMGTSLLGARARRPLLDFLQNDIIRYAKIKSM
ncbi:MAG: hypothetical protein ACXVAK_02525 [Vulcanimicrobiaceae bacterium]